MALPPSGTLTTDQVMNELAVPIQPRDWPSLWGLALANTTPKNKANAGGPYVFPDDWWGYNNTPFVNANLTFTTGEQACLLVNNTVAYQSLDGTHYYYDEALTSPIDSQGQYWKWFTVPIKTSFDGQSTGSWVCD